MRTIKSQCGKTIVNAQKLENARYINDDVENKHIIIIEFGCALNSFAEYSTEKRALRVLELLNEWICAKLVDPHDGIWEPEQAEVYRNYACFQMPQDGEELDK